MSTVDIAIVVATWALVTWVVVGYLLHCGTLHSVEGTGFIMRNGVGRDVFVAWERVGSPIKEYRRSLPRLVIRRKGVKFLGWPTLVVLLRGRPAESALLSELRSRAEIRPSKLENIGSRPR